MVCVLGINDGGGWEIVEAKWRVGGIRRRPEEGDIRGRGDEMRCYINASRHMRWKCVVRNPESGTRADGVKLSPKTNSFHRTYKSTPLDQQQCRVAFAKVVEGPDGRSSISLIWMLSLDSGEVDKKMAGASRKMAVMRPEEVGLG